MFVIVATCPVPAAGTILSVSSEVSPPPVQCDEALTSVFALLGKRWNGVILGSLLERPARFAELAAAIPGITEAMLSARLTELQSAAEILTHWTAMAPRRHAPR